MLGEASVALRQATESLQPGSLQNGGAQTGPGPQWWPRGQGNPLSVRSELVWSGDASTPNALQLASWTTA